jgi:hypothetical protein
MQRSELLIQKDLWRFSKAANRGSLTAVGSLGLAALARSLWLVMDDKGR